jgi:hypothetical protein
MYDDDRDALAAEYVLGTLSAQEREEAEALLTEDAAFAETVRLWEHRLGELNVMVEAVEPPPDLWERIKSSIDGAERRSELAFDATARGGQSEPAQPVESPLTEAAADASPEQNFETVSDLLAEQGQRSEESSTVAALASTLLPPELATEFDDHLPKSATAAPQRATRPEAKALEQKPTTLARPRHCHGCDCRLAGSLCRRRPVRAGAHCNGPTNAVAINVRRRKTLDRSSTRGSPATGTDPACISAHAGFARADDHDPPVDIRSR